MTTNKNPVVMIGVCRLCGGPVALFKKDQDEYLAKPSAGLAHTGICPEKWTCPVCGGLAELTPSGAIVCREHGSEHFRVQAAGRG